jgi:rhamnogalacturonan endolyase
MRFSCRSQIWTSLSTLLVALAGAPAIANGQNAEGTVTIVESDATYTLDNGIVTAMVAKASGDLVSLRYKGLEMLATFLDDNKLPNLAQDPPGENKNGVNRGMTDHQYGFWSHDAMGVRGTGDATAAITIHPQDNEGQRAEVSIKGVSGGRGLGTGPGAAATGDFIADVEIRWALGRGESGVYTYTIFEHLPEYGATTITEARFCAKLNAFFDWMSVDDNPHRHKFYPADLVEGDKYIYTANQFNNPAFGWSSTTEKVGFFIINPSMEYMSGGPTKIEFLGHRDTNQIAAPCVLNYWRSSHYGGAQVSVGDGENWAKVIGPFMLYVNAGDDPQAIYSDARNQAAVEKEKWPFAWVSHPRYPLRNERADVSGRLALNDPVVADGALPNLLVGLTAQDETLAGGGPGGGAETGWQRDAKYYQFWVRGDQDGTFTIPNVRPGEYTLRAMADGVLGELAVADVRVEPGRRLALGEVEWKPRRRGKQLWEIGVPNRNGSEFKSGDVYYEPDAPRAYSELFPDDVRYVIGKSDYRQDWYFAHVPRVALAPPGAAGARGDARGGAAPRGGRRGRGGGGGAAGGRATPFVVEFELPEAPAGIATLRVAISGTGTRQVAVEVNGQPAGQIDRLINDGTISRHGIQGLWYQRELAFDASLLKLGANTLTLTVPAGGVTAGVIYDYLRLELDEEAN